MNRSVSLLVGPIVLGLCAVGILAAVSDPLPVDPTPETAPFDFVCFDIYGKKTSHEGVVLQELSHGGVWILTLEDSTEIYYTAQHGETCLRETSTGVQP